MIKEILSILSNYEFSMPLGALPAIALAQAKQAGL
jgi:hypothetical protein